MHAKIMRTDFLGLSLPMQATRTLCRLPLSLATLIASSGAASCGSPLPEVGGLFGLPSLDKSWWALGLPPSSQGSVNLTLLNYAGLCRLFNRWAWSQTKPFNQRVA